ncbi:MAG: isoaspartyl peptidase/L-asparaginase [Sandaracinaceae bacterium]|nr:isoaspartyl peptidase/L-asparaginase [Sandaracinaceae bacterium]
MPTPVILVHGGAGAVDPARRPLHAEGCARAAEAGRAALAAGGRARDAVLAACAALEDDPLFNAGHGACLTAEGTVELDAAIMDGERLELGAVACLPPFANPIRIADAVRADGVHTLYAAQGAARFARDHGFAPLGPDALVTDAARERLARVLAGAADRGWAGGTVGAVACDAGGHVAAATSTGGTVAKRPGRVGDTPLAGAGTWADDLSGACSATGVGEAIMRLGLARRACDLLHAGSADEAARRAIEELGRRVGGSGGLILVDNGGRTAVARNTETMSWALARLGEPTESGF